MKLKTIRFIALLFTALTLGPALAHLLELPNKIGLPKSDYLTVQQIYRGWFLLGIVVYAALLSNLLHVLLVRGKKKVFGLALAALLCIVGAQVIFWTFTFPANQATRNWTTLPENWEELRVRWEYSHATGAVLTLTAFITLTLSVLVKQE